MIYALVIVAHGKEPNPILYCHATNEIGARNSDAFKEFFNLLDRSRATIETIIHPASTAWTTQIAPAADVDIQPIGDTETFETWVTRCADTLSAYLNKEINISWNLCYNEVGMKQAAGPGWRIVQKLRVFIKDPTNVRKAGSKK